jgi:hypothetical protein
LIAVLSACGGGTSAIIAVIEIVTPLGGDWGAPLGNDDEKLDFNTNPPEDVLFASDLILQARLTTASTACGGPATDLLLEGNLSNGELVLRLPGSTTTCLQGEFTDLVTLEAGPPGESRRRYENDRVDVQMQLGLWISDGSGDMKLKFELLPFAENNVTSIDVFGCDLSGSPSVEFEGEMDGFNTTTRAKPSIPELRPTAGGASLFTQGVFVDGDTITLVKTSNNETVTFHRQPDNPQTPCP